MANVRYFIGIDVGTGSVRAAVVDEHGKVLSTSVSPIKTWNPIKDHYEQSSKDIWNKCGLVVQDAIQKAFETLSQTYPSHEEFLESIIGIGFDATCSLVLLDENNLEVTVSSTGNKEQNIILWMDHRAIDEAQMINQTQHEVLKYVGGQVSLEMEIPKLLWLKKHIPESFNKASKFLDLVDFLTYKATGDDSRSLCTVVCKWNYMGHKIQQNQSGWEDSYFQQIGLSEFTTEGYKRIGTHIRNVGESLGHGLTDEAATHLGLKKGTAVSVGLIDAHAGGVGVLGSSLEGKEHLTPQLLEQRLALISGTSTCHMVAAVEERFCQGIWGPYYAAMIPGMWLTEGGQSATGSLLDRIIYSNTRSDELIKLAKEIGTSVYDVLNQRLEKIAKESGLADIGLLTKELHVLPYFHGNRSPRADPSLTGTICGLTLGNSLDDLALLYLATIQSIAYGTKHIIQEMNTKGHNVNTILMTGGSAKNALYVKQHSDITSCKIAIPQGDAVLVGAAVIGSVASKHFPDFLSAMSAMNKTSHVVSPATETTEYHNKKYQVFMKMYEDQMSYRNIMNQK